MQRYKVTGPRPVLDHAPGDEFDYELSPADEQEHVSAGRLEIVPRKYRVLSHNSVHGPAGAEFELAFPAANEQALLEAGQIERVDDPEQEDLAKLSREDLNERAAAYGVTDAESLPNKQAVIDAIDAAREEGAANG